MFNISDRYPEETTNGDSLGDFELREELHVVHRLLYLRGFPLEGLQMEGFVLEVLLVVGSGRM